MQRFLQGLTKSLDFVEKNRKDRQKASREKKAAKELKYGKGNADGSKKVYRIKSEKKSENPNDGIKRTGRVHVMSVKPEATE